MLVDFFKILPPLKTELNYQQNSYNLCFIMKHES